MDAYIMKKTARGFSGYGEFLDSRGCRVRLTESSIAGDPHAYLFCQNTAGAYTDRSRDADASPHLTVEQAEKLVEMLNLFIAQSKDPKHWKNDPQYMETWRKGEDT